MKKNVRKGFVYFRYIMPLIMIISFIVLMFIPCYRFITADTGVNQAISLWELLGNSWKTVREYIFGNGEKVDVTLDFARTLLVTIIALWGLFALGAVSVIYSTVTAVRFFTNRNENNSKSRILFVTLTVNRLVLCIYHALMIPIFMLPKLMPYLYGKILNYYVELYTYPFDMLWIAIGIFVITISIIAIDKKNEVLTEMNIYLISRDIFDDEDDHVKENGLPKDIYESMSEMAKTEQAERIRRLLNRHNDGEDDI